MDEKKSPPAPEQETPSRLRELWAAFKDGLDPLRKQEREALARLDACITAIAAPEQEAPLTEPEDHSMPGCATDWERDMPAPRPLVSEPPADSLVLPEPVCFVSRLVLDRLKKTRVGTQAWVSRRFNKESIPLYPAPPLVSEPPAERALPPFWKPWQEARAKESAVSLSPAGPVAEHGTRGLRWLVGVPIPPVGTKLYAAAPSPAPSITPEPVAEVVENCGYEAEHSLKFAYCDIDKLPIGTKLYAHPAETRLDHPAPEASDTAAPDGAPKGEK